ncbi:Xaa-Pro peptidase family protein [Mycoplasma cottewii]|uniref:Xaa-Pro peptidase family protein n=1 Tax=Mycoplasma cottewii TaxID=51364 RepID=A0ABY5TX52_9MOLU|nr:Xaa-Pro peptidase family protein [Mycoplasma cottewii]UWD35222.1 Xaa-Pro peptidase family protein [Mycoplasma cottewii]
MNKHEIIVDLLNKNDADAILLYSPENRYWFSRFHSSLGYLLITKKSSHLFLDGRYITAARESKIINKDVELYHFSSNLKDDLNKILKDNNVKKLAFEADWIFYKQYELFRDKFFNDVELVPVDCSKMRMIKDSWEIANIKKACDITDQVFQAILDYVKPGMTEKQLQRFVDDKFLEFGADKISFDTIIASGVNGSKPHAVPSDKVIQNNELITIDMGCFYNGYCSDQTRTIAIGEVDSKLAEIYDIVYEAQSLGISLVKAGVNAGDIHRQVHQFIDSKGYGKYFDHGLGHGIGVEIHEEPGVGSTGQVILQENMTITVEPGIYIPGLGGVRIEDDVLVTKDGCEMLTSSPRTLIKLDK